MMFQTSIALRDKPLYPFIHLQCRLHLKIVVFCAHQPLPPCDSSAAISRGAVGILPPRPQALPPSFPTPVVLRLLLSAPLLSRRLSCDSAFSPLLRSSCACCSCCGGAFEKCGGGGSPCGSYGVRVASQLVGGGLLFLVFFFRFCWVVVRGFSFTVVDVETS
jgi:hypothetical protein